MYLLYKNDDYKLPLKVFFFNHIDLLLTVAEVTSTCNETYVQSAYPAPSARRQRALILFWDFDAI